jgi:putative transposase
MCRVLEVSRSGFYDYLNRGRSRSGPDPEQVALESRVKEIFRESKKTYGSRRMLEQLKKAGYPIGRYRVRGLMRKLGLKAKEPRRYKVTTDSNHKYLPAPNLLDRQFEVDAANKVWSVDISVLQQRRSWVFPRNVREAA